MRVYLPVTSTGLAAVVASREVPAPVRGHAVTEALRRAWPDGDEEQWEYAALMAAASDSLLLRSPEDRPRRHVLAVDVAEAAPASGEDPTAVEVADAVPFRDVAAAHVDTRDDPDEDEDLAWFARQEIGDLVRGAP